MAAIDLSAQRVVLTKTGTPLKPGAVVKPQILLATLLSSLGFSSVTIGTTAPGDQETLWYNKDNNTFRRYNPLTSTWAVMTPTQWTMHLLQIAFKSAGVEGLADNADKIPFFDVSANETKMISVGDLKASLGVSGWVQYGSTQTLVSAQNYVEFDLPTSYRDFFLYGSWTSTGAGSKFSPILAGVYPSTTTVDFGRDMEAGTFTAGSAQVARWWGSGDRGDLTGRLVQTNLHTSLADNVAYAVADRVAKIRYRRPDNDSSWQFAIGSVFKLFVR